MNRFQRLKVYDELIHTVEGVRMQCIKWKDIVWNIFSNDRFEEGDFEIKIHCEICGPKKFVPKVIDYRGHRICNSCIYTLHQMLNVATLDDCSKDRNDRKNLEQKLNNIKKEIDQ